MNLGGLSGLRMRIEEISLSVFRTAMPKYEVFKETRLWLGYPDGRPALQAS